MASSPGALGRRYLPFIALAAVQVIVIALAPSRGGVNASAGQYGTGSSAVASGASSNGSTGAGSSGGLGGTNSSSSSVTGSVASGSTSSSGSVSSGGGLTSGGTSGVGGTGGTTGSSATVDRSDCAANGTQKGPINYPYMPACVPVWPGGNNGGATMTGVTSTEIRYVVYKGSSNAEVNAILQTQGLAATTEQSCEADQAFNTVINKYFSLYGRHFVPLDGSGANNGATNQSPCNFPYYQSQCNETPPDPACEVADAKVVAAMHPAFVIGNGATAQFANELSALHIVELGGGEQPEQYYQANAPYFYGILMDGTRQAQFDAELYCKDLINKPVKWAGPDVETTRGWGSPPTAAPIRKLAVLFPETNGDPTYKMYVDIFKSLVTGGECNTKGGVLELPYQSDITTAQQQSNNVVQQLIQNKITTVECFCDPIAPVFLTNTMQQQGYFPENLIAGVGLIDYDVLGRLYATGEWQHAFGLSDLALSSPIQQSWSYQWYAAAGASGSPDSTEDATVPFFSLMATAFQEAGPEPTPGSIHQGLLNMPPFGGWAKTHNQTLYEIGFGGSSPWTAFRDARLVNWSATRPSEVDGKAGSYCPLNGGERYDPGQLPTNALFLNTSANGC